MNRKFFGLLFIIFAFSTISQAQSFPGNKKLKTLLDSGEYFRFKEEYQAYFYPSIDTIRYNHFDKLYFESWLNFLFNKSSQSNFDIETLLRNDQFILSDSIAAELLQLHIQNDLRLFNYSTADSISTVLIAKYADVLGQPALAAIRNSAQIFSALKNVPPQTVERKGDLDIKFDRDLVSLIRIPVSMNGQTGNYIFDTGANFSTMSESEAKKMGVKILDANFGVTSSSRTSVDSKLGVADKLEIGNVTFRNVVFIILPDASLKFLAGIYKIKGIIGLPVIAQLGEVQITKDDHLFSPVQQTESSLANLGLEGNTPFIEMTFYGTPHDYVFDTGAAASVFGNNFGVAYRDSLTNAKEGTAHVGGAGGIQKIQTKTIKNVRYSIGNSTGVLKSLTIQLTGIDDATGSHYGIAGEDIFMQWKVMIINFDKMFVLMKDN